MRADGEEGPPWEEQGEGALEEAPARQASPLCGGQPTLMALARQVRTRQGESCRNTKFAGEHGSCPQGEQFPEGCVCLFLYQLQILAPCPPQTKS